MIAQIAIAGIQALWIENPDGAKFWLKVFNDLKRRGVNEMLDHRDRRLEGHREALAAVFDAAIKLIWLARRNITADRRASSQGVARSDETIRDRLRR